MSETNGSSGGDDHVLRVLVIDDQDVARDYMTRLLENAGYSVSAQSSPLGVTRQVIREGINVVIIDVEMPALRGDKLVRLFRQNRRLANLGLVLVSSKDQEELAALGRAAGADAVVTKKNLDRTLVTEVKKLFSR